MDLWRYITYSAILRGNVVARNAKSTLANLEHEEHSEKAMAELIASIKHIKPQYNARIMTSSTKFVTSFIDGLLLDDPVTLSGIRFLDGKSIKAVTNIYTAYAFKTGDTIEILCEKLRG